MKFFLSILYAVVFVFSFAVFSKAQDETRATVIWQIVKYDINANLVPNERTLTAKAILTLKNIGNAAGSSATLRISPRAEVLSIKNGANDATFTKGEDRVPNFQILRVRFPAIVQPASVTNLTVDYKLSVPENSGVNAISPVGTQFLPILTTNADTSALQLWYPTTTNPFSPRGGDFAPFNLTVTAGGETVISSGNLTGNSFTQPLNALPFFLAGNFETVEGTGENKGISAFLAKGVSAEEKKRAQEVIALTGEMKNFTAGLFGTNIEVPIRLVSVRRGAGFADGGTILLDRAVFRRQKNDAGTILLLAESIAKIWLGNKTPIKGEGLGVIREGLTRYIALQFIEKHFGKESADLERLRQRIAYANVAKRELPLMQTTPLDDTYFATVPNKGAMIWRLAARSLGNEQLFKTIRTVIENSSESLNLAALRNALSIQSNQVKIILDENLDQATDTDLIIGLPQVKPAETVVALRNLGSGDVTVNVQAVTDKGEKINTQATILSKNFSEAVFKTTAKIVRVEVDPDKFYPQIDYSNDIAPREATENDWQLEISRSFVRQEFTKVESLARKFLQNQPRSDEARTWLGRSLAAQNKSDEAEKEFRTALDEKMPTLRTLALGNLGLAEIEAKRGKTASALSFYKIVIKSDAEYGANLTAREGIGRIEPNASVNDESVKNFFAQFDKAVLTGRKTEVAAHILPGEMSKFASGIVSGQPEQWQTTIKRIEQFETNLMSVETSLNVKRLGKDAESGSAVFLLAKVGNTLKLVGIESFEVR